MWRLVRHVIGGGLDLTENQLYCCSAPPRTMATGWSSTHAPTDRSPRPCVPSANIHNTYTSARECVRMAVHANDTSFVGWTLRLPCIRAPEPVDLCRYTVLSSSIFFYFCRFCCLDCRQRNVAHGAQHAQICCWCRRSGASAERHCDEIEFTTCTTPVVKVTMVN